MQRSISGADEHWLDNDVADGEKTLELHQK